MPIQTCVFDTETSSLNANFGIILCAVFKEPTKKPELVRIDEVQPDWYENRENDREIVQAIARKLLSYDLLVAHNGKRFDLPFLNTRMAHHGLGTMPRLKIIDPCLIARQYFRMSSNSLDAIYDLVGENVKTRVSGSIWTGATLGAKERSKKCLTYIADHCVKDVAMLEKVLDLVKGYSGQFDHRGSAW